jgi:hypothetical protein
MSLSQDWRRIWRGKPGRRFVEFHQARCKRRAGRWPRERVVTLVVGTVLLVGGLAIGWLPGPGGFVAILGAALLGVEWLRIAELLDRAESLLHGAWLSMRKRLGRTAATTPERVTPRRDT